MYNRKYRKSCALAFLTLRYTLLCYSIPIHIHTVNYLAFTIARMKRVWPRIPTISNVCRARSIYSAAQENAYRSSVKLIQEYSEKVHKKLQAKLLENPSETSPEIERLQVLSQINLPEVRSKFHKKEIDYTNPVFLYMLKQQWEDYQKLLLLQRLEQMKVIKDSGIGSFSLSVDVQLGFNPENNDSITPGTILPSTVTVKTPWLSVLPFNCKKNHYSVITLDLDVPNYETNRFETHCNWLLTNIPIEASKRVPIDTSKAFFQYRPPIVHRGEDKHRILTLVLRQKSSSISIPSNALVRERFDLSEFCSIYDLEPVGAHLWRSGWDSDAVALLSKHPSVHEYRDIRVERIPA